MTRKTTRGDWTKETRQAPRWAWQVIDDTLQLDAQSTAFDPALRDTIGCAYAAMEALPSAPPPVPSGMRTRWVAPGEGAPVATVLTAWDTVLRQDASLLHMDPPLAHDPDIAYLRCLWNLDIPMDRTELTMENPFGHADETDKGRVRETLYRAARRARRAQTSGA